MRLESNILKFQSFFFFHFCVGMQNILLHKNDTSLKWLGGEGKRSSGKDIVFEQYDSEYCFFKKINVLQILRRNHYVALTKF